jgi:hypothetical protein
MRKAVLFLSVIALFSCRQASEKGGAAGVDFPKQKGLISAMLDSFNLAAANADFDGYFRYFADSAVFIGTDATEYWIKPGFMVWAKPYFDKKTTWDFKAIRRNIYFGQDPDIAWFDELLNTQMKICRGSGVVVKQGDGWKVQEYVLSMTIPNTRIEDVLKAKSPIEDSLLRVWR